MDIDQERSEWDRKMEDSMNLYCNKCQSQFRFEKFNNFLSSNIYCCCCYRLKAPINHNKIKYTDSDRSTCCEVCRKVKINNLGTCDNPEKFLCNYCPDDVSLRFMKHNFNSLSEVHDFYSTQQNAPMKIN